MQFIAKLVVSVFVFCAIIVATQDIQIFPGAWLSLLGVFGDEGAELPKGVDEYYVTTEDQKRIHVWRLGGEKPSPVFIIFHGNAGDVRNFFPYQRFLHNLGYTSYGFDYRGFGQSSGWPSERGLFLDSKAVFDLALKQEGVTSREIALWGISVGSGPASELATIESVRSLILLAPFTSLPELIREIPLLGLLHRFSFYSFPVESNVAALSDTCLVVAAGERDNVVPVAHARAVSAAYNGTNKSKLLISPRAGHNDILFLMAEELAEAIMECS